jgi:drug/metabolite transporter (DMT)-like permease
MNTFLSWLKNILVAIIISTIMILLSKYILKNEISTSRMVLVYIVYFIIINILWLIKRRKIKFGKIKYSIIIGILCWGIPTATLMSLFINTPAKLDSVIIYYLVFMVFGFVWGIITYSITKKLEKKTKNRVA